MFKKIKNRKGFTLIELIVVIAILAVLAAIIIPTIATNIDRANNARDLANTRSAYAAYSLTLISLPSTAVEADLPAAPNVPGGTCSVTATVAARTVTAFSCTYGTRTFSLNSGTGAITGP